MMANLKHHLLWFLTHFCPALRFRNQVPTFAVRETDVSRTANVGTVGKNGLNAEEGGENQGLQAEGLSLGLHTRNI